MTTPTTKRILVVLLCTMCAGRVPRSGADEIRLTNGRTMQGVISTETDQSIVLEFGVGSTRIERERIANVQRASPAENEKLRATWRQTYFLHHKFVPPALADLATGYKQLLAQRDAALRAQRSSLAADQTIRRERQRMEALQKQITAASRALKSLSADADMGTYNQRVRDINSLRADLTLTYDKIKQAEGRRQRVADPLSGYMATLNRFKGEVRKRQSARTASDKTDTMFFERLEWKLAELTGELTETAVPAASTAGSLHVAVVFNNEVRGMLVVDTGAALVALSPALAARLGIATEELPGLTMTVADGRPVEGKALTLESLRVGDAEARDVPAVILPAPPGGDVDGLLGMSFLRHFAIRIDGATGNLVLSRFTPE